MKAKLLLSPLVLAMAGVFAVSAAHAGGNNDGGWDNGHKPPHHQPKPPKSPPAPTIPVTEQGGATAVITDAQYNYGNNVTNYATQNNASANGSIGGASGNVGANVAAGDNNQQANAVALATADESFVFGYANASTSVTQQAYSNNLTNYSTANNASVNGSLQGISGNYGVNVAAGNFNQQKNDMAAAVSNGQYTSAGGSATQTSTGNTTVNNAHQDTTYAQVSLNLTAGGGYAGVGGGTTLPDDHHSSGGYGPDSKGGPNGGGGKKDDDPTKFVFGEVGVIGLGGIVSGWIPMQGAYTQAVVNNASLNGSIIGVSGNVGVNVAAGGGNQQSNSLSIGAGCTACAKTSL